MPPPPPQKPRAPLQPGPPQSQGRLDRCPCPHCQQPMNFSAHVGSEQGGTGWGEQGLEKGAKVDCDHCGNTSTVLAVETVTLIRLVAG